MHIKSLLIILTFSLASITTKRNDEFSYKTHGSMANYFESEKELSTFFDIHAGEVVAEIGAGNGTNMRGFNKIANSVTFYVQDIDEKTLSQKAFNKAISFDKNPSKNSFIRVIGTEKESMLPDNSFDKIALISTFHEFSNMDEMMTDIYKKLKSNGQLYILESHCATASHKNITVDEAISLLKNNNFELVKKEEKDINNSKGLYRLVFRKI